MTHPISMPAIQPSLVASIAISCAATRTSMCWVAAAARITDILSKSARRAERRSDLSATADLGLFLPSAGFVARSHNSQEDRINVGPSVGPDQLATMSKADERRRTPQDEADQAGVSAITCGRNDDRRSALQSRAQQRHRRAAGPRRQPAYREEQMKEAAAEAALFKKGPP
jgi:orotidine-5'-phosphate decarboxylase